MEVDFTDQIIELKKQDPCESCACNPCICGSRGWKARADEKAGYPPNCNEGYEEKDGKCVVIKKSTAEKSYPGKSVKRRKDGVPKKKMKKRACKPGEYRDKSGNLKKTSKSHDDKHPGDGEMDPIYPLPESPQREFGENPRNVNTNPHFNKDIDQYNKDADNAEAPEPKTREFGENPRNINEYYKNLYRKAKGLD
jgi:hypothetical protein